MYTFEDLKVGRGAIKGLQKDLSPPHFLFFIFGYVTNMLRNINTKSLGTPPSLGITQGCSFSDLWNNNCREFLMGQPFSISSTAH